MARLSAMLATSRKNRAKHGACIVDKFDAAGFESESDLREEFSEEHWTIADLIANFSLPKPHAKKLFKFLSKPASGGGGGSASALVPATSTDIAAARGSGNVWGFFFSHAQAESGPQVQVSLNLPAHDI